MTPPAPDDAGSEGALAEAARGFAGLSLPPEYAEEALRNLRRWLEEPVFRAYRETILRGVREGRWDLLLDSFYRVLPFGTGGRRGAVGIGPNRFNPYTLQCSVQGNAEYLRARYPGEPHSVVIAYDVREFHDLRGRYGAEVPSPLTRITSRDFARLAAEVYAGNGVRVWMPAPGSPRYVSTPELSFTIRRLGATGGLNVSASHNHPDENGGKFYNRSGAQDVPPEDAELARLVAEVSDVSSRPLEDAVRAGLVSWIPESVHEEYLAAVLRQSLRPDAREARVVFTPLHGTGSTTVLPVLERAGFRVDVVPEQSTPDGGFPAVPYRAPNPEVEASMEMGVALARELGADLVLACDPDADRLGAVSRTDGGGWRFLTGNEIAVLVAYGKLAHLHAQGRLTRRPLVLKTEVTTELLGPVVARFGGRLVGDLLVGFKYHAAVLDRVEREGEWEGVPARLEDFVVAVEESHGVLVTHEIRDKDAAGGALVLAELASLERRRGRTLADLLDDVHREFGYYANLVTSVVMSGAEGLRDMQRIQDALRARPPGRIGGLAVEDAVDDWDERGRRGPFRSDTDRASRNVVAFRLHGGARVAVRPSGTEPKSKVYVEVPTAPLGEGAARSALDRRRAEADALAGRIADDLTGQMLRIVGVDLPSYALRISGLVPLDRRVDFVERFLPQLERSAEEVRRGAGSIEAASSWVDRHLAGYGMDARRLVGDAVRAWLAERRGALGAGDPDGAARLDVVESVFFRTGFSRTGGVAR